MAKVGVQCCYRGCRIRRQIHDDEWARIKAEGAELGARAGLLCPEHFEAAVEETDEYDVGGLPAGELLAELAVGSGRRRWRICWLPAAARGG